MANGLAMRFEGLEQLNTRLQGIKLRVRNRLLRRGFKRVAAPIAAEAQGRLDSISSGDLSKVMQFAIRSYRRGQVLVVMVGAARHLDKRLSSRGKPYPRNLAALLEFGHGGPHPGRPIPLLRPAWDARKDAWAPAIAEEVKAALGGAA